MTTTLPRPGDYIASKYRVESILGMGGMGAVFEVSHRVTQKRFAIKWLLPEHATSKEAAGRLIREAQVAGVFDHPNVVQVYDAYDAGGELSRPSFIVMELLQGETLADRLARVGRLSCSEVCSTLLPCMDALSSAHAKGIVHRDLKPANIFMCRPDGHKGERPKLLDFGIAKLMPSGRGLDAMRTQTGMIMGTPLYMAPEQMRGRPVDPRVDVYAMGVTLYQALCGEMPFSAATLPELVLKITGEDPEPLERYVSGLPEGLSAIVARAMARDPRDRIQSMDALIRELKPYQGLTTPAATPLYPQPSAADRAKPPPTQLVTESAALPRDRSAAPRWPWAVATALCIGVAAFALLRGQLRTAREEASAADMHPVEATDSGHEHARPAPSVTAGAAHAAVRGTGSETTSAAATNAPGNVRPAVSVATRPGMSAHPADPDALAATMRDARQAIEAALDAPAQAVSGTSAQPTASPEEAPALEVATTDASSSGATASKATALVTDAVLTVSPLTAATATARDQPHALASGPVAQPTAAVDPSSAPNTDAPASAISSAAPQPSDLKPPAATPDAPASAIFSAAPQPPDVKPAPAPGSTSAQAEPALQQPAAAARSRTRPKFGLERDDFLERKPSSSPLERPKTRLGVGEF